MKKITIGILAHVDAGKTTLSEAILYTCGAIKKPGRVDNRDSYLDNNTEERKRGITIFSKPAKVNYKTTDITFIDTPGHVDFSGEMERTLQILDYAVLVISGTDGPQAHTATLVDLLKTYNIPFFIFITKMDVSKLSNDNLMAGIRQSIGEGCMDFSDSPDEEACALCDELLLDKYLTEGAISSEDIAGLIKKRKIFPCYFGSGLKCEGIKKLLDGIDLYCIPEKYGDKFAARVYKISRDNQGKRLTFVKITGGQLSVREAINDEKVNQIRVYSGHKYDPANKVSAGDICALMGLNNTFPGQGLGEESGITVPTLSPVLKYKVILPKDVKANAVYPYFKELEDEDPLLNVVWNEKYDEIEIRLMGKVQTEVLKSLIKERFNLDIGFDSGRILYKETIANSVEGIGHYEPLKHYAEVHLLIEPLPGNSGIEIGTAVPTDDLDLNWQRLILTHLAEKQHLGVLTGAPLTDVRITLIAGKAHLKHTEGGDFRQATYRAVRQGLMSAKNILLEPMYSFSLEIPNDCVGRAISDIHARFGENDAPLTKDNFTLIKGRAPVSEMTDYAIEVLSYTGGKGKLSLRFSGYNECHNQDKNIAEANYSAINDLDNPADSIFCSHGAGVSVPWNDVPEYCHIPPIRSKDNVSAPKYYGGAMRGDIDEKELEAIMMREFGPIKRKSYSEATVIEAPRRSPAAKPIRIIIDGYNVIYSWENLKTVAKDNIDLARSMLTDILVNYRAYTGSEIVLVYDAYLVEGGSGKKFNDDKLHVVYTSEGESADNYIEKLIDEIGKNENVKVVTSDAMIQLAAVRSGVLRISSKEFKYDVENALAEMRNKILKST